MARARNIKPGFFKNEDLAEIEPLGRLLFAGLWTLADREGRMEDRPKRIKAELLPYDDCNPDALLDELHNRGFILRYLVEGERYIVITAFDKHQNPHRNESESVIPCPNMHSTCTDHAPKDFVPRTEAVQEMACTAPADSLFSESLISDSLITDSLPKTYSSKRDRFDPAPIVDLYHQLCPSLAAVVKLTDGRKSAIKSALARYGEEDLQIVFSKAEASDFLTGRAGGDRSWSCGIDWLLKPANTVKVLEGIYDNKKPAPPNTKYVQSIKALHEWAHEV